MTSMSENMSSGKIYSYQDYLNQQAAFEKSLSDISKNINNPIKLKNTIQSIRGQLLGSINNIEKDPSREMVHAVVLIDLLMNDPHFQLVNKNELDDVIFKLTNINYDEVKKDRNIVTRIASRVDNILNNYLKLESIQEEDEPGSISSTPSPSHTPSNSLSEYSRNSSSSFHLTDFDRASDREDFIEDERLARFQLKEGDILFTYRDSLPSLTILMLMKKNDEIKEFKVKVESESIKIEGSLDTYSNLDQLKEAYLSK